MRQQIRLCDAAELLGISRWTIRRWARACKHGCPPAVRLSGNVSVLDHDDIVAMQRRLEREALAKREVAS